jgi:hypothetical protein
MREAGLRTSWKRRFVSTTDSRHTLPVVENVLDRQFDLAEPNRAWVSDITDIRTAQGYLSAEPQSRHSWPVLIGLGSIARFNDSSLVLRMRSLPGTAHRSAAGGVDSFLVTGPNRQPRGTLSPEFHTRPLPVTHVRIGTCWSYSRSQSQHSTDRGLGATRQGRVLPPTACRITRG